MLLSCISRVNSTQDLNGFIVILYHWLRMQTLGTSQAIVGDLSQDEHKLLWNRVNIMFFLRRKQRWGDYGKRYWVIIIIIILAPLALCCWVGFSLVVASWGLLHCSVQVSHCGGFSWWGAWALERTGFSICSTLALEHRLNGCAGAELLCSRWDLPGSRIKPVSPALAGEFFARASREAH